MTRNVIASAVAAAALIAIPQTAQAYIGPGAGIAAIGTFIALVGAVLLAVVGFVWYPIKRLRAGKKAEASVDGTDQKA